MAVNIERPDPMMQQETFFSSLKVFSSVAVNIDAESHDVM